MQGGEGTTECRLLLYKINKIQEPQHRVGALLNLRDDRVRSENLASVHPCVYSINPCPSMLFVFSRKLIGSCRNSDR